MKTIEQLKQQNPIFLNDWKNLNDLENDFQIKIPTSEHVLFASYTYENYSGNAFVLLEKDGDLYEVNGSHCSCYGLEDQWEPQITSMVELEYRLTKGTIGSGEYKNELMNFLGL